MSNIDRLKKGFEKIREHEADPSTLKSVTIVVRGSPNTMADLNAVGERDLMEFFVPQGLRLAPGDKVSVRFNYR